MGLSKCCITFEDKKKLVFGLLYRKSNLKCTKGITEVYSKHDPELYKSDLIQAEEELTENKSAYDTIHELELCNDTSVTDEIWSCGGCITENVQNELKKAIVERIESSNNLIDLHKYRRDDKDIDQEYIKGLENNITDHQSLNDKIERLDICR